jgi:hypothetical protein
LGAIIRYRVTADAVGAFGDGLHGAPHGAVKKDGS